MNNKAQISSGIVLSLLVAGLLFFAGMLVMNFIKSEVMDTRDANTCSTPSTDGTKALCLVLDFIVPYMFIIIISVSGGMITSRFLV